MSIEAGLEEFRLAWTSLDVDGAMRLFHPNVEYWETPFQKLQSYEQLRREWRAVAKQHHIELKLKLFSSAGNKHVVMWHVIYQTEAGESRELAGTYLLVLDDAGQCTYFHHTGELRQ